MWNANFDASSKSDIGWCGPAADVFFLRAPITQDLNRQQNADFANSQSRDRFIDLLDLLALPGCSALRDARDAHQLAIETKWQIGFANKAPG
jgi:hypothetical protein